MKLAVITVIVVLSVFHQTEAGRRIGGGRAGGRGGGRGLRNRRASCGEQTKVTVSPCGSEYISCPEESAIQIDSVQCKERCARGRFGTCDDATLQTTIEASCNGEPECTVEGISGDVCRDVTTVILVDWSCEPIIP